MNISLRERSTVARERKQWSDLSPMRRKAIVCAAVVQVSLALTAWWDLAHRPTEGVRGSKRLWAVAILVNFVGPIAYFVSGRKPLVDRPGRDETPGPGRGSRG